MRFVLPVLLCVALVGCGSSNKSNSGAGKSDDAQVRAAAQGYMHALMAKDYKAACASMTDKLKSDTFAAMAAGSADLAKFVKGKSCEQIYSAILKGVGSSISSLNSFKVVSVKLAGTHADYSWTISSGGKTTTQKGGADKVDGKWLVSCCVGSGTPQ